MMLKHPNRQIIIGTTGQYAKCKWCGGLNDGPRMFTITADHLDTAAQLIETELGGTLLDPNNEPPPF